MSIDSYLAGWDHALTPAPAVSPQAAHAVRRYAVTADVQAYETCRRQYGLHRARRFPFVEPFGMAYGTMMHEVLERITRRFKESSLLTPYDAREVLLEVHARGVRAGSKPLDAILIERAARCLERFCALAGPAYFGAVRGCEVHVQAACTTPANRSYILGGVIDAVMGPASRLLGIRPLHDDAESEVEIWDYKASRNWDTFAGQRAKYEEQLRAYAGLYQAHHGRLPTRAVLVYLGELGDESERQSGRTLLARALHVVDLDPESVAATLAKAHGVVDRIEDELLTELPRRWLPPEQPPATSICQRCAFRLGCARYEPTEADLNRVVGAEWMTSTVPRADTELDLEPTIGGFGTTGLEPTL